MLYLHGGGYTMGSAYGSRALVGALCVAAKTTALLPEYRLAPEHPYPAAIDDAERAYKWLLARTPDPSTLTLAGDSSGGGLTLSLLARLKQRSVPLPGRVVLLCPWLDLTGKHLASAPPPLKALARASSRDYLSGHPADDPTVNPLKADPTGYPPILLQAGTGDPLIHEARLFTHHAQSHNVKTTLDLYPVEAHVFQLFWSFLPEATQALTRAATFISHPMD